MNESHCWTLEIRSSSGAIDEVVLFCTIGLHSLYSWRIDDSDYRKLPPLPTQVSKSWWCPKRSPILISDLKIQCLNLLTFQNCLSWSNRLTATWMQPSAGLSISSKDKSRCRSLPTHGKANALRSELLESCGLKSPTFREVRTILGFTHVICHRTELVFLLRFRSFLKRKSESFCQSLGPGCALFDPKESRAIAMR